MACLNSVIIEGVTTESPLIIFPSLLEESPHDINGETIIPAAAAPDIFRNFLLSMVIFIPCKVCFSDNKKFKITSRYP